MLMDAENCGRGTCTRLVKKPKILVDARFKQQALGGDRCRFELARNLHAAHCDRYFFLLYEQGRQYIRSENVIVAKHLPSEHPWSDVFEHVSLPSQANQLGIDIYHGTFNVLPLLPAAKLQVLTLHDMAVFAFPQAYSARFVPYMKFLIAESAKRADCIVTVSDATKGELLRFLPQLTVPIVTVLNGVALEFLQAKELGQADLLPIKQRYSIDFPYILFVGNLELKKNLPRLIQAFESLKRNHCLPHKLLIAGKPLSRGPQDQLGDAAKSDSVRFLGYVDDSDLPKLYKGADLIAYPSLYEGFGMPVLEGMACGVPVLTSTVSSLPEVAANSAWLVDPYNVESIAQGLHDALTQDQRRQTLIHSGLERARTLSWKKNTDTIAKLYEDLWTARNGCSN
jgi:glycosyltransferase involved in cell wall biosynthesis